VQFTDAGITLKNVLQDFVDQPLAKLFALAMHRELRLAIPATDGHMTAAALMGFERAALSGENFLELLRSHNLFNVFHSCVEVNTSVES
jgi:hypothetical protein